MSSDEAYASFLEQANQSVGSAKNTSTSSTSKSQPSSQSGNIPPPLKSLDATFTSESDEPFEPFTIPYSSSSSSLPGAPEFAKLVEEDGKAVDEMSMEEFDPRGEYGEVIGKVKDASSGGESEVKIFRVEGKSRTIVVYYVVGLDQEGGRLVGVRAVSVET